VYVGLLSVVSIAQNWMPLLVMVVFCFVQDNKTLCSLLAHTDSTKLCSAGGEGSYDIYRADTAFRKCKLAF
jgi:hypothetical protein